MGNLLSSNPTATQSIPIQVNIPTTSSNNVITPISTTPPAITPPIMEQQTAQNILNLQNSIISTAKNNAYAVSNINLPASQSIAKLNVEGFAIQQQPPDLYQKPMYISASSSPELNDYASAYNKSVALLDDPNRMSQANFDAYIHLQDNKIAKLQSAIASFPTNAPQQNNPIRSIKNLKTSASLNVEPYPDPATQTNLPNYYTGNGATTYPNYLIYTNNGCLQYAPPPSNNASKGSASWSVQSCNSNLSGQRFNMKQVNNMAQYNALITDPNSASYKITDPNSSIFGFYIVNPEGYGEQCLQLNGDGLSVMPCNMDSSQRFKPYYHSIKP
jgi:hypothetical protein